MFLWRTMRKNKYNNSPTTYFGITFDSRVESEMYLDLRNRLKTKRIRDLVLQPRFELLPSQKLANGKTQRKTEYVADFMFWDTERLCSRVVDCKGMKTRVYQLKKKMYNDKYGKIYGYLEEVL